MGNHPSRGTLASPSARTMSPIHETPGRLSRTFSFNSKRNSNHGNSTTIYNEILRDAEKQRVMDQKNKYNHHRRLESIASNLPDPLESYSNAIYLVNEFWLNHFEQLSEQELNELVMVIWAHLFLKFKQRRAILITAQKASIGSHALKMLKIFSYVIRNLVHPSNHLKLFKQLQALGAAHRTYSISNELYDAMLDSFNFAMEEKFSNDYKVRTRFCFSQIYQVIVDIMIGEDFYSYTMSRLSNGFAMLPLKDHKSPSSTEHEESKEIDIDEMMTLHQKSLSSDSSSALQTLYHQIDGFLGSLEECLSDEVGSLYFKKYLEEQFCSENFLFHEAVLKYKSAKNKHKIRVGQQIIADFVEIGAAKEVNLSYNTRKQILSIVKLVQKLNDNKDKYQQLLNVKQTQQHIPNPSILSPDDISYIKHEQPINNHYRMATTKKFGLQLAEITLSLDENIEDVIYSMGFTDSLFDTAYDEIFNLMKNNSWHNFRSAILEYCGDDEFRKLQRKKLEIKRKEQKQTTKMVQVINRIAASHRKYTVDQDTYDDDGDNDGLRMNALTKQTSIHDLLRKKSSHKQKAPKSSFMVVRHKNNAKSRRISKDDLDLKDLRLTLGMDHDDSDYDVEELPYKARKAYEKSMQIPALGPVLTLNESISCENDDDNKDKEALQDIIEEITSDAIDEDLEFTVKRDAFKPRNQPRLSFIPTMMPSIEKSDTSPIVKVNDPYGNLRMSTNALTSGMTPGGGACVDSVDARVESNDKKIADGKYSPSQLFDLVSTTFPWDYSNKNTEKAQLAQSHENNHTDKHQKRTSGIYKSANGRLPLYVTHKKRKSRLAKKKRKSRIAELNNSDKSTSV